MNTPRMTEQELAEAHRRIRISKMKQDTVRGGAGRATDATHGPAPKATTVTNRRGSDRASKNRDAGINPAPSPYKSKWEAAYASKLELEKQAGIIKAYWYEPFSLWLPGKVRYKPDFLIQYPDGLEQRLEIKEIKGWSRNRRDGITRLKIAAALFPCFRWTLVVKDKNGWDETEV